MKLSSKTFGIITSIVAFSLIFGIPRLKKAINSVSLAEEMATIMCTLKAEGYTTRELAKKAYYQMGENKMVNTPIYGKLMASTLERKIPDSTPSNSTPTRYEPSMPVKLATIVKLGNITKPAIILGVTRYWTGFTARDCNASICSVTRMVPSSAAIAEPALAFTIKAVRTGPNSLVILTATIPPTMLSELNVFKAK